MKIAILDICKKILQRGIDPNAASYDGTTALMIANKLGDRDKISWLQGITAGNDKRSDAITPVAAGLRPSAVAQQPVEGTKQSVEGTKQSVGAASLRLQPYAVSGAMPRLFFLDNYRPLMMSIISSAVRGWRSLPGIFK